MVKKIFFGISSLVSFCCALEAQPLRFEPQIIDSNIAIGYGLAAGDVDGDGKMDVLLADKKQFVWYRNGDWKRFVIADSLTRYDNVCIAARDINGDGKVEIAAGAQWNPGETADEGQSGSVHYLVRPTDPTRLWTAVALPHEPTVHRMQWVKTGRNSYSLVVVPLHGRGNKGGEGSGAKVLSYSFSGDSNGSWKIDTLEKTMHLTHNFDVAESNDNTAIYLGGKEGIRRIDLSSGTVQQIISGRGVGEVRIQKTGAASEFIATIEPMHGDTLVVYQGDKRERTVLDSNLKEGHALAIGDFLGDGSRQVLAGWRAPNKEGKVGLKLYFLKDKRWESFWVDENGMACEDVKVADLNGDGKPDIVASGRATHNLKIYWNRSL